MRRMFCMLFPILLIVLYLKASGICADTVAGNKEISLKIINIESTAEKLDLTYQVTNVSDRNIWVYSDKTDLGAWSYGVTVNKERGGLKLSFKSVIVPDSIMLEAAIIAIYEKLLPGDSLYISLSIGQRIEDFYPESWDKQEALNLDEVREIQIEVGYYDKGLEKRDPCCMPLERDEDFYKEFDKLSEEEKFFLLKSENCCERGPKNDETCCWHESSDKEMRVNCFWAMINREKIVGISLKRNDRWEWVQGRKSEKGKAKKGTDLFN